MTGMLRDMLGDRAESAGSPDLDLQGLIAQGERRVRQRRRVTLAGTVAAVTLTVGGSLALVHNGDLGTAPEIPPTTSSPSTDAVPDPIGTDGGQPLTYGVGSTIHYGDRVIESGEDLDRIFLVDDGLLVLTGGDGAGSETRLSFTDGVSNPVEIARGIAMVTGGDVGTPLLWLDGDDVVIYDTHAGDVIDRVPLNGMRLANPITPLEDAVYWTEYDDSTATTLRDGQLVRYDLTTGTRAPVSRADYRADAPTAPLVVGSAESTDGAEDLTIVDSELRADAGSGAPEPVFVSATGERVRVRLPSGYEGRSVAVFQWLDDDQFALVTNSGVKNAPIGDLLLCRITTGRCRTVASGEQDWLFPGPIGGVGSEG